MRKRIYLDHAATSPLKSGVLEAMMPYLTSEYGNASSAYEEGRNARKALEEARNTIANAIGALSSEIYFTASGTEADNWAICSVMAGMPHMVTCCIEHPAVLEACRRVTQTGMKITYLSTDIYGTVSERELESSIRDDTAFVSVMTANNEIGTIQPVSKLGEICRRRGVLFHTDAVQAVGSIPIDVRKLNVDMLSMSAHKFGGPKGIGALYIRSSVNLQPFIVGGHQERGRRASTENVAGAVGMAKALEICVRDIEKSMRHKKFLSDHVISRIQNEIPLVQLNGSQDARLPGNVNFSFRYTDAEALVLDLDSRGIAVSGGAACSTEMHGPSHVLTAIGLGEDMASAAVRITFGDENTLEEADIFVDALKKAVLDQRRMSPYADPSLYTTN